MFYGWWNVAASFVGLSLSYAMFTVFAFGVFLKPLAEEFGWQRDEMSFAYTVTNLTVVAASVLLAACGGNGSPNKDEPNEPAAAEVEAEAPAEPAEAANDLVASEENFPLG